MILWIKHQRTLKLLLFTRSCHDSLSAIFLTQNLFHKIQRAPSLNSDCMVIFKNPQDNSQLTTIARQIHSEKVKLLMWAYKNGTSIF